MFLLDFFVAVLFKNLPGKSTFETTDISWHTVDGRNPASPGMYIFLKTMEKLPININRIMTHMDHLVQLVYHRWSCGIRLILFLLHAGKVFKVKSCERLERKCRKHAENIAMSSIHFWLATFADTNLEHCLKWYQSVSVTVFSLFFKANMEMSIHKLHKR